MSRPSCGRLPRRRWGCSATRQPCRTLPPALRIPARTGWGACVMRQQRRSPASARRRRTQHWRHTSLGESAGPATRDRRAGWLHLDGLAVESPQLHDLVAHLLVKLERAVRVLGVDAECRLLHAPLFEGVQAERDQRRGDTLAPVLAPHGDGLRVATLAPVSLVLLRHDEAEHLPDDLITVPGDSPQRRVL